MSAVSPAFTPTYQRPNKHYATVLYGAVPAFVVYVAAGLAGRLRFAGSLGAAFATTGSALAAFVVGSTVPLHREDGRA